MRVVEFGSLFQFIRNGMSVKQDKSGDGLPITRIETIADATIDEKRVGYAGVNDEEGRRWLLESGDILFSHINSVEHVGKCAVYRGVPEKLVHGMNLLCLRCDQTQLLPEFAKYLIRSPKFRARLQNFINKAVNQASLSIGNLKPIPVGIPTIPEQRRIAAILDQADALRAKRREALAQLDSLKHSIFVEMFGDPVGNPKAWEIKKLKEISKTIVNGTTPNGGSLVYVADGIIFFRSQNVWKNSLLLDDVAYIDSETHSKMQKSSLQNKDILITKTGRINTENSSLGRAAIFSGKDGSANINGHVYLVRLEIGSIHEFVLHILITDEYREYIRSVCVGGIDKRQINKEHLDEFPIISPPLDLQRSFAGVVESIERQKSLARAQLAALEHMFSSLQHRAFRGEL